MLVKADDKPWFKSYKLGPYKLAKTLGPFPKMPLYSILNNSAATYPARVAIEYLGRQIKYAELKLYADSLANALHGLGVKKGDKVAIILPTCPQFIISDFGILKTGAVPLPCSILHKAPDLEYEIGTSEAETVICLEESLDLVSSVKDKTKLRNIIVTSSKDYTPEEPEGPKRMPGVYQLRDLIAKHEPKSPEVEVDPMEDLACLAFTGGATGVPKGVMSTHYNWVANIMQGIPWVYSPMAASIKGRSSVLIPIPLFHAYGHFAANSAIYWGLRLLLVPDPRDTDAIVNLMKEHRPYLIYSVPTQLMRMTEKKIGRMPVMITSGSAPLPKKVADAVAADTMMPVSEGYGLTETVACTHMNLAAFSKITGFMPSLKSGSVGVPVPDTDVKLVDPDTGKDTGFTGEGEVFLRGPQLMKGYWPTPGNGLVDGWLPTGDIGKMDDDGYLYIVDRVKDMANISGYKVYTSVIDDALFMHPAVSMAVAIGIPDPEREGSERVKAFIKLKEGYDGKVTTEELIDFCRDKVPPYARPKFVEFREDLPFTVTEKLFKRALREEEIKKMKEAGVLKWM